MGKRLVTLDALRGIAALSVAFYHVGTISFAHNNSPFIRFLGGIFEFGNLGVAIFFAISGFVIAASISSQRVTFGYFGKFLLKRSLRLDPTYWASILVDLTLTAIAIRLMLPNAGLPSAEKIIAHLFYSQDLLGLGNISGIYWTLCLEVQFYIVFCLAFALRPCLRPRWSLGIISVYSALISAQLLPIPIPGLFVSYWTLFIVGAAAYYWGVQDKANNFWFPAILCGLIVTVAFQWRFRDFRFALSLFVSCLAAATFYYGARQNKLALWLNSPILLYFGSRSYSIYLFHTIIGERGVKILAVGAGRIGFPIEGAGWALCSLVAGLGASLLAAEIAFRLIERPSMLFSKQIGSTKKTAVSLEPVAV